MILVVAAFAVWVVFALMAVADTTSPTSVDELNFTTNVASLVVNLAIFILYWLYESLMAATRGQTIGKMIMGLRITDSTGEKLSMGAAMKRSLVWLVPLVPCCVGPIGFLVIEIWGIVNMFNRPDRCTLMDQFADSTVTFA